MKKNKLILLILVCVAISCCSTAEKTTKENPHPFKVVKATYNNWVGGLPGSNGITVHIAIDNATIKLDTLFFRNHKVVLSQDKGLDKPFYTGSFKLSEKKRALIMSSDPREEYGNEPPNLKQQIPFILKEDQAVISYVYKNKIRHYNIDTLKKTATIYRY